MKTRLIIDGNAVYEIDLDCMNQMKGTIDQVYSKKERGNSNSDPPYSGTMRQQIEKDDPISSPVWGIL